MSAQTFPAPVVKELREEAKRHRLRARSLELVIIRREIAEKAPHLGSNIPSDILSRVSVDDAGAVKGLAEAISILKP